MEALCAGCRVSVIGPRHAGETSERQRWIPDAQGATRAVFVAAGMGRLAFRGEARRVPARLCAAPEGYDRRFSSSAFVCIPNFELSVSPVDPEGCVALCGGLAASSRGSSRALPLGPSRA